MKRMLFRQAAAAVVVACALPMAGAQTPDFRLGSAIDASQAERSIVIGPDTRWANVRRGESIRFVAGQAAFGWKFDGTRSAVDLARIAPGGFVAHPVTVYVAPSFNGRPNN